jgi:hypothetical protein
LINPHVSASFLVPSDISNYDCPNYKSASTSTALQASQDNQLIKILGLGQPNASAQINDKGKDINDSATMEIGNSTPDTG